MNNSEILEKMKKIVRDAAPIFFDNGEREVTVKGDADFVTKIDLEVQDYFAAALGKAFPEFVFLSEELEKQKLDDSRYTWILDPVDGTTNLIHHYRQSAVSLGLVYGGSAVAAVVFNPFSNEMFAASAGGGAELNGKKISVSAETNLKNSLITIGTMPYDKHITADYFGLYRKFFENAVDIRRSGSAALDLCYVADGRSEVFFEKNLKPWDFAAGELIVREAGGSVTDWKNRTVTHGENSDIIASNGTLHDTVYRIIQEYENK